MDNQCFDDIFYFLECITVGVQKIGQNVTDLLEPVTILIIFTNRNSQQICAQHSRHLVKECQNSMERDDAQALVIKFARKCLQEFPSKVLCMAKAVRRSDVGVEYIWPGARVLNFGWRDGNVEEVSVVSFKLNSIDFFCQN